LRAGFVDALAAIDDVVPHALTWLQELLRLAPLAMAETRRLARRDLADAFADRSQWLLDEFTDAWFGAETQATLHALVARLKK